MLQIRSTKIIQARAPFLISLTQKMMKFKFRDMETLVVGGCGVVYYNIFAILKIFYEDMISYVVMCIEDRSRECSYLVF